VNTTLSMLLFGLALSVIQLSLGIAVGLWYGRRTRRSPGLQNLRARENQRAATRLLEWTQQVADDVHGHSDAIGDVNTRLSRVDGEQSATDAAKEHVVRLVRHLSLANENLQTQLAAAETNLQYQAAEFEAQVTEARTDALTGLANRRSFDEELAKRFSEWCRYEQNVSLILLDVDRFKDVNDHHGHLAGDAVLAQLAEVLATARETDIVTRYGGEEFAIVLPHTHLAEAEVAAERIRVSIATTTFTHGDATLSITVSYGLARFAASDDIAEGIVARADMALYASKIASRNNGHQHDGRRCLPIRQASSLDNRDPSQPSVVPAAG
jgi:diguanylate cyclase (GGDEF)-like protein